MEKLGPFLLGIETKEDHFANLPKRQDCDLIDADENYHLIEMNEKINEKISLTSLTFTTHRNQASNQIKSN